MHAPSHFVHNSAVLTRGTRHRVALLIAAIGLLLALPASVAGRDQTRSLSLGKGRCAPGPAREGDGQRLRR